MEKVKVRIGYYVPGWPPGLVPNGIVTTLGYLGAQLREMGHHVHYVTPYIMGETHDVGVSLVESTRTVFTRWRFKWNFERTFHATVSKGIADAVSRLVSEKGIEIFQMEESHGWASAVIRQAPIPVIVRLHGPWFLHRALTPTSSSNPENRHRIEREGEAIRRAAGLTAPSHNVLALSREFYTPLSCATQVIPNPIPTFPAAARWKLDSCDQDLILFVGRFDHHKGGDLLLRAFGELARERSTLRLVFVGPDIGITLGNDQRLKFDEFLREAIPVVLRSRIDYRGPLSQTEIAKLRTKAYLTVVSSRYETFGNVVIEAMAAGCPIVATDAGGISEILINDRNGLIAPVDDIKGLAAAMGKLLDDSTLAIRLGEQAARDCREKFDPQKIAQQTLDFYSMVIAARNVS